MKCLKIITIFILIYNITYAQSVLTPSSREAICGSIISEDHTNYMNRTRELRESTDLTMYRQIGDIPIAVHVITGGTDASPNEIDFDTAEVGATVVDANTILAQVGIQLVQCMPVNFISEYDNSSGMTIQPYGNIYNTVKFGSDEEFSVAQAESVTNVINIFIVYQLVDPLNFPLCGWATFPGEKASGKDWVFLSSNPDDCSNYGSVLAHEIGHYFNLYHTHSGEREGRINELESRTNGNCGLPGVGDELCDTPADPYYNIVPSLIIRDCSNDPNNPLDTGLDCELDTSGSCQVYDYTVTPPVLYMPDPTNVMSYGHGECRINFSQGQIERFLVSLIVDRPDLLSGSCDNICREDEYFDYTHIHSEDYIDVYAVEKDILSEATILATGYDNAITIYNAGESVCLRPPFNAEYGSSFLAFIDGCDPVESLRVPRALKFNSVLSSLTVSPNPFNHIAIMEFDLLEDEVVTVSIFDLVGNQISNLIKAKYYQAGKHQLPIDGTNLPAGIYYCTIQAGDHIETQKMVLTK